MVDQELIERVTRLPVRERLELIELLTRSLRGELIAGANESSSSPELRFADAAEESIKEFAAIESLAKAHNLDVPLDSSLHWLRGIITRGAVPTTKDEVRDIVISSYSSPTMH